MFPTTRRLLPYLLVLALAVVAITAPAGQARGGGESSPEASAQASQKAAEREERAAARKARRESEKAAAKGRKTSPKVVNSRPPRRNASSQPVAITSGANGVQISCTSVVWEFDQFPGNQSNTVREKVTFIKRGSEPESSRSTFTFQGASGTNTTTIDAPIGTYTIDAEARWAKSPETVGRSGFDLHTKITCEPRAAMTVAKLQKLDVPGSSYANTPLTGEPGQTVDYQILVQNTGNVPLTLGAFTDPRCDENTITGGPAGGILAANTGTEYLCTHVLTAADLTVGKYENTVQLSGTPTEDIPTPVTEVSNTVETVVVPVGSIPPEDSKGTDNGGEKGTPAAPTAPAPAATDPATSGSSGGGKSGVLAFSATGIPSLKGPRGCVRSSFHASIKSAGVASVIFYLDSHKLKKLTARNARKGLLVIAINRSKLTVGAHRLVANITMQATVANAKAATAARSLTVRRCRGNKLTPILTPRFAG